MQRISDGDRLQAASSHFRRELAAWIHPNRSRRADGMPASTIGTGDVASTRSSRRPLEDVVI